MMDHRNARNTLISLTALAFLIVIAIFVFRREGRGTQGAIELSDASRPSGSVSSDTENASSPAAPQRSASELPPEGTPWFVSKQLLFARALRGDKAAADRLFRDTQTCGKVLLERNELETLPRTTHYGLADEEGRATEKRMNELRESLARFGSICTEADAAELAKNVDQIALAAVQAGNRKAAACYLDASFHDGIGKPQDAELERYVLHSSDLIEAELKQGNWDVVSVMAFAYSSGRKFGLYAQLVPTDPAKEYAYLKLQQLGAVGSLKKEKDERVNAILASGRLSEDDVRRSDEWAESMFTKYFHEPLTSDQPPDCYNAESGR